MPTDFKQAIGFLVGMWLAFDLLIPLVAGG